MVKITPSRYKDQPAITMESDLLRAQFLPTIGSKLCSLVYKPRNFELMVQMPGEKYRLQPYDGVYIDGECSGFDEMFPTIDTCYYERYPWQGTKLPDHGEVWSIAWEHRIDGERLHMSTYGVRLPYKLEKWVSFAAPGILRIEYTLTNLSDFDLDFMWAAHPMINIEEGAELMLPPGVEKVVTALSFNGSMGRYGDEFAWPEFRQPDGQQRDLRKLRPKSARDADKYFIKGKMPAGWCALTYPQSGFTLALSFPVETVPYLAVLPNECGWRDLYNIFLEPATASFDRLDVARLRKEVSTVGAHAAYRWHLNFTLTDRLDVAAVSDRGRW